MGYEFRIGRRARVLPRAPPRGRLDRAGRLARHARAALLRHARAHAQPGLRLLGGRQHHRARLGQLRHRPRGRQRPVRAELRLRRRADDLRPGDLLPLHGRVDGPGARADRHLHAEALPASDGQRLPLPHEPVARRRERLRRRSLRRPARPRAVARRPTTSSAGSRRTRAPTSRSRRRPSRRTSGSSPAARARARRGRRSTSATATTTARRCSASRPPAGSRTARSTAPATPTSPRPRCSPPGSTASRTRLDPGDPTTELNLHDLPREELAEMGIEMLPGNLLDATRALEADDVLRTALGTAAREDYVDYFVRDQAARVRRRARADHPLGARALPPAVLSATPPRTRARGPGRSSAWSRSRAGARPC